MKYSKKTLFSTPQSEGGKIIASDKLYAGLVTASTWRKISFLFILVCIGLTAGLIFLSSTQRTVVYVVEVDNGQVKNYGKVIDESKTYQPSERIFQSQLENYITSLRFIAGDKVILKKQERILYFMSSTKAINKIREIQTNEGKPTELLKVLTRDIEFNVYSKITENTRQYDWTEYVYDINGKLLDKREFRGTFIIIYRPEINEEYIQENPLSIYIDSFTISEIKRNDK